MTKKYTDYNDRFTVDARKLYDDHQPRGGSFRAWMQRTIEKLKFKEGVHYVVYTIPGVRYFNITYRLTDEAGAMLVGELVSYIQKQQARKAAIESPSITLDQSPIMQGELPLEGVDEGEIYEGEVMEPSITSSMSDRTYIQNSFESLFTAVAELGQMVKAVLTRLDTRDQVQQSVPEKKYLTIREYAQVKGKSVKFETMQALGAQVSKYCREYNIPTVQRKSDAYGHIGAYPIQALELVNKEYGFIE